MEEKGTENFVDDFAELSVSEMKILLRQQKKDLEDKDKVLGIQKKDLEDKDKVLEDKDKDLGVGRLIEQGLPPLGKHNASTNQTPMYGTHSCYDKPVLAADGNLGVLGEYSLGHLPKDRPSQVWKRVCDGNLGVWNHEVNIQSFVKDVIVDIIDLAGVKNSVEAYMEIQLSVTEHLRPDIVIFRRHGVIIGVCEVKKPSDKGGDLDNDVLRVQISNYMLRLKYSHGLKAVFGITTTYNEWKICWLHEANNIAEATEATSHLFHPSASHNIDFQNKEILYETKIFKRDDPHLVEALVSVIRKMMMCPVSAPTALLRQSSEPDPRKFGKVDTTTFSWQMLPSNITKLSYEMIGKGNQYYYLIEDFHGGADGRVWLCINSGGRIGVLKLSGTSSFEHELTAWTDIWNIAVRRVTVLGCNALLMPYAFHGCIIDGTIRFRPFFFWHRDLISTADFNSLEVNADFDLDNIEKYTSDPERAAREALEIMAAKRYIHNDISWRHVALLPVQPATNKPNAKWTVTPILIDCNTVRRVDEEDNLTVNQFVDSSLEELRKELRNWAEVNST